MADRPILFQAAMVRALLAGTKTQTRRVVVNRNARYSELVMVDDGTGWWPYATDDCESQICYDGNERPMASPYGVPGDRLWVREAWRIAGDSDGDTLDMFDRDDVQYRADDDQSYIDRYRPSIHLPRRFSRITLEVTGVRVERLHDISDADAIAEGVAELPLQVGMPGPWWTADASAGVALHGRTPKRAYAKLWESINGPGSWDANPWLWVINFKRLAP
jgi:hypothetical protein